MRIEIKKKTGNQTHSGNITLDSGKSLPLTVTDSELKDLVDNEGFKQRKDEDGNEYVYKDF